MRRSLFATATKENKRCPTHHTFGRVYLYHMPLDIIKEVSST